MMKKLGVIELFAGAAGLAQGFLKATNFDLLALTDAESSAQATFQANYPHIPYLQADIVGFPPERLHEAAKNRQVDGLLGGPPCQGFSLAGSKILNDERNRLIHEYARFVEFFEPRFLLMENVPQMLFHPNFEELIEALDHKYQVRYAVLNAAQYGTPQTRHRAFVLAYHRDLGLTPTFPMPTHEFVEREVFDYKQQALRSPGEGRSAHLSVLGADPVIRQRAVRLAELDDPPGRLLPLVSIEDAIGDLNEAINGESLLTNPNSEYQRRLRCDALKITNFNVRIHATKMQNRIDLIPEGGDLRNVVEELYRPKSHYSQAYGRLHNKGLARTITTYFCNAGSGRFLHPVHPRTITVREAARLQGFDDRYEFHGTQAQQMKLVGNAVPVPLAEALGRHIAQAIRNTR